MKYYKRCYYILIIRGCDINFQKNKFPHVIVPKIKDVTFRPFNIHNRAQKNKKQKISEKMGSGCRGALLCKSSSLAFLIPSSFTSSHLRFNKSITNSNSYRMATGASSSSASVTGGDTVNSSVNKGAAPSASSAIDFLSLCHSLKVFFKL